jgi:2-C-methyl-D-erythritol 4-phosphate cytidylyltransferase
MGDPNTPGSVAVVIVAAGRGRRLGGETPKQYLPLGDHCAIRRAVAAFLGIDAVSHVQPVIHPDDVSLCDAALGEVRDMRLLPPIHGAETRALSVRKGLEALAVHTPEKVLIHDAARPFVSDRTILDVIAALERSEGACAALPVVDAVWRASEDGSPEAVPRDALWRAQTPQGFDFERILSAHLAHDGSGADDVTVAVEAGLAIRFVLGGEENYKITTNADYTRALTDAAERDDAVQPDTVTPARSLAAR